MECGAIDTGGDAVSDSDLDTIADIQMIAGLLCDRGFAEADIEHIFHGNWSNLLQRVWTAWLRSCRDPTGFGVAHLKRGLS